MQMRKSRAMKISQGIMVVLIVGAFLFFILGEMLMPAENVWEEGDYTPFETEWVRIKSDGTTEPMTVPGECKAERGEWVTLETTLSKDQSDEWMNIRSLQQDLKIYIGDELRKEYSTHDTQLFGKTSTMTYVIFPLYSRDAGKKLRIRLMTESSYAGVVSEIHRGEKSDITQNFIRNYLPSAMLAFFMMLIGFLVLLGSWFVRIYYKRKVELAHLGSGILIASTWLVVESKFRQFILPNASIAMLTGFLMIALIPYPFLSYLNRIQKGRYGKIYAVVFLCTVINSVTVTTLQVMNIRDFYETMTSSHVILVVTILLMAVTIVRDIIKGHMKDYREVVVGFVALMLAGICELSLVSGIDTELNGIALCIGLMILLFTAGLKTVRDLFEIEKEKQIAIAASESKAKFLANMSHEIRTPINTVIGMNEMILRENEDKTIDEYARNVESASHMLLSLINDVLDFSKMEAGKLLIVERDYAPSSMLYDVVLGVEVRTKQKNLELKLDIDEKLPAMLKGDEVRIKQILNNLLSNAVKYTEEGSVTLSAKGVERENGFELVLSVADTGIGVREEDVEKLFNSFQRLEMAKNQYIEGTGLGLNITKQLVDSMHGTIGVESEYGVGSCFTVSIPQGIVDAQPMGKITPKGRALGDNLPKQKLYAPDAKILVVDDNEMNLTVVKALLRKSEIQLDCATGGRECVALTKKKKYDLILMDHMMPEPDGVQTFHMIREDKDNMNHDTEVIMLTANAIEGVREQYLEEGFADYLAKPLEVAKLEATIARFLDKR